MQYHAETFSHISILHVQYQNRILPHIAEHYHSYKLIFNDNYYWNTWMQSYSISILLIPSCLTALCSVYYNDILQCNWRWPQYLPLQWSFSILPNPTVYIRTFLFLICKGFVCCTLGHLWSTEGWCWEGACQDNGGQLDWWSQWDDS